MKLKAVDVRPLWAGTEFAILAEKEDIGEIHEMVRGIGLVDQDADYEIIVRKKQKRKTKDQNAYAWELIGELARKLRRPPTEIYREIIRDMPTYDIVPIKDEAVAKWIDTWSRHGIGWICEDMGACKRTQGYRNIKCFYGSSTFNRSEMSQFLDTIIEECHEQGIGTLTPLELASLEG